MSKVIFVCGLIGAGKTTWTKKHAKRYTDLDELPEGSTKADQIRLTKRLLKQGDVFYITCYPQPHELKAFDGEEKDFVMIDTNKRQAKTNILIRGRLRDLDNLDRTFHANRKYWTQLQNSNLPFRKVKVMA